MNKFEAERRFAQRMKDNYPPGTRIMLLQMGDDPRPSSRIQEERVKRLTIWEHCTVISITADSLVLSPVRTVSVSSPMMNLRKKIKIWMRLRTTLLL